MNPDLRKRVGIQVGHGHRARIALILIFAGALSLRLALIFLLSTYRIDPADNHWAFGYELGRVGKSLAEGSGFASPMRLASGPTAWFTPVYPLFVAAVFKLFGVYTVAAAIAIYFVNSALSALTCVLLYWLAKPVFGHTVGLASAILFALYPAAVWHSVNTVWNTSLMGCAMVLLIGLLMRVPSCPYGHVLATGVLMGFVLLIDPSPAFFYPFALGLCLWMHRGQPHAIRNAVTLAILTALLFAPWMLRNYLVLGVFAPRCCPGLELKLGNNDTSWRLLSTATSPTGMHPGASDTELSAFLRMGEVAYNRQCKSQAIQFIRDNPGKFLGLSGLRFLSWWFGQTSNWKGNIHTGFSLAPLKQAASLLVLPFFIVGAVAALKLKRTAHMILLLLLVFPIPYYFIHVSERKRFPIEPFLVLLAAKGLLVMLRWMGIWKGEPTSALAQDSSVCEIDKRKALL